MLKSTVLAHFKGNRAAVARALGITRASVSDWPKDHEGPIPEGSAYKLQVITKGKLKVDPASYPPQFRARKRRVHEARLIQDFKSRL